MLLKLNPTSGFCRRNCNNEGCKRKHTMIRVLFVFCEESFSTNDILHHSVFFGPLIHDFTCQCSCSKLVVGELIANEWRNECPMIDSSPAFLQSLNLHLRKVDRDVASCRKQLLIYEVQVWPLFGGWRWSINICVYINIYKYKIYIRCNVWWLSFKLFRKLRLGFYKILAIIPQKKSWLPQIPNISKNYETIIYSFESENEINPWIL